MRRPSGTTSPHRHVRSSRCLASSPCGERILSAGAWRVEAARMAEGFGKLRGGSSDTGGPSVGAPGSGPKPGARVVQTSAPRLMLGFGFGLHRLFVKSEPLDVGRSGCRAAKFRPNHVDVGQRCPIFAQIVNVGHLVAEVGQIWPDLANINRIGPTLGRNWASSCDGPLPEEA